MKLVAHPQTTDERRRWMARLARKVATESQGLRMIEVGSWVGESAIIWASTAKAVAPEGLVHVLCIDAWAPYASAPDDMSHALKEGIVQRTFEENIRDADLLDHINGMRADSRMIGEVLMTQAVGIADLVYIDGDHSYDGVSGDLRRFAPFVRDGGYLCGDDLEGQLHEANINEVKANSWRDGYGNYHPGVTLAVGEFFGGPVSCYEGFWVMQKDGTTWKPVALSD